MKLVETLDLDGWSWLKELKGAVQTGNDDAIYHRMSEVITGRPVLSMAKRIGDFAYVMVAAITLALQP